MSAAQNDVINTLGLNSKRKLISKPLVIVVVVIVAVAAYMLTRNTDAEPPIQYVTQAAAKGALTVTVTATGTLQPTNQVDIGSEVSGIIEEVLVDFNDVVTAGQIIARLDTQTLEARLASARAALAVAEASRAQTEATMAEARAKANRSEELALRELVSKQDLETNEAAALRAEAAVESAKAQVTSNQASLKEAETALAKAVIRSPIDGVIISREIDPGQTMAAAFEAPILFIVAEDLRQMQLHLDIDESDIGQVKEGQQASFRVDAFPGQEFKALITSVRFNPREVNNIVTYETVLTVANPDLLLRPGMTATADILVSELKDVLLVPNQALRFLPSEDAAVSASEGDVIWIVEEGKAVSVPVTVGLSNGVVSEITGGNISSGTGVITDIEREARVPQGGGPF